MAAAPAAHEHWLGTEQHSEHEALGDIRATLNLNGASRVFVINTEGATDPERYAKLVGMGPDEVATRTGRADA